MMHINPFGDQGLIIQFENKIDPAIHASIMRFLHELKSRDLEGIHYYVPAFASITVGYDSSLWHFEDLAERLWRFWNKLEERPSLANGSRTWKIPVCFEDRYALDRAEIIAQIHLSWDDIIDRFTSSFYTVYMIGFLPGFPYLGLLPEELACARKGIPRKKVAAQSIGLAGRQTGIYPSDSPGGWQIIGRTPVRPFDTARTQPFLFAAGDQVSFQKISQATFTDLAKRWEESPDGAEELYA